MCSRRAQQHRSDTDNSTTNSSLFFTSLESHHGYPHQVSLVPLGFPTSLLRPLLDRTSRRLASYLAFSLALPLESLLFLPLVQLAWKRSQWGKIEMSPSKWSIYLSWSIYLTGSIYWSLSLTIRIHLSIYDMYWSKDRNFINWKNQDQILPENTLVL